MLPAVVYLGTLAPTLDYRDSPEFIDTAFSLGISHPAGFPTYNLLAKTITFLPLGSMAFKVNLFSMVFACLTLIFLYLTTQLFLEIVFGPGQDRIIVGVFPVLFLAFSEPFWYHALIAEVYSLHSFFTCLIIYHLLQWRVKADIRYLFSAAFFYGLSAGNHATVVFYLPAILLLFLAWQKKARFKNIVISSLIFIIGFSVYLYLPVRSLAEPTIDWGNPETVQGFLYHVTDRQHANTHFDQLSGAPPGTLDEVAIGLSGLGGKALHVLNMLVQDLNQQLTAIIVVGFLFGGILCFKANRPLYFFFFLIVAMNAAFFVGWRKESYFPSHIVACMWTSAFLAWLFQQKGLRPSTALKQGPLVKGKLSVQPNGQTLVILVLVGCVLWQISSNYNKVDRSGNYFAESLLKRMVLSLDNDSIFVAGISWFNVAYHQDVMRLRDDVTFVKAWDFLDVYPPSVLTSRKYPDLKLPTPEKFRFGSREESYMYLLDFFNKNAAQHPVLIEQNISLLQEFPLAEKLAPHNNLLLRYLPQPDLTARDISQGFAEFKQWMEEELSLPGIQHDPTWIRKITFYIPSFAAYFHSAGYYKEERDALRLMKEFLGQGGVAWDFKMVDNYILSNELDRARQQWKGMKQKFPNHYETHLAAGILLSQEGKEKEGLNALNRASDKKQKAFRPYFESAKTRIVLKDFENAKRDLGQARARITSLEELKQVQYICSIERFISGSEICKTDGTL